jgi:tetraacyldisaccharide 4'-kinase
MLYRRHPVITVLLLPFSVIYGIGVSIRNFLFDSGVFPSRIFDIPVISVGNITVGGTGKTPHVEYILSLLKNDFKVAVLSRGYKRKTSGFIVASETSGVDEIGDEPLQIKKRFPDAEVAVDGNRVRGIQKLCSLKTDLKAIILDDAFQHRWVKPGITVLLMDYNQPIKDDYLLPAGRLREFSSASKRAAIVVVTKCPPDFKPIERRIMMNNLSLMPWQTLYFSEFSYGEPVPVFDGALPFPEREEFRTMRSNILMVTGIASPGTFENHLRTISKSPVKIEFPDHHQYSANDMKRILKVFGDMEGNRNVILTTEKDAMRFRKINDVDPKISQNLYYFPISVRFLENDGKEFKHQILRYVRNNKRNHLLY